MRINRRFIFRYYWLIAIFGLILGIWLFIQFPVSDNSITLLGSVVAAVLGFCYFVLQQKLSETALFKELFTEFNKRYDVLNDRLSVIATSYPEQEITPLDVNDRQTIIDYFNLCAEEYLFFKEGYIHHEAWRSWCAGMTWYFDREPFKSLWAKESSTKSYYGLSVPEIKKGAA